MPRIPEKITKWKTTDGHEFDAELQATTHQRKLDVIERVTNQLHQFYYNGMPIEDLAKLIVDYRVELLSAFGA